ncbi:EF-hand domain-containing protein [Schlesneria paludicola]|uniref:EF-hand domain-containing protein n=1 Tax=Schlesneria paludicola TaxID=360056 RepID=UPI00029A7593|nr:EF-hand domain-containing protein [Schlesneria paludicola]
MTGKWLCILATIFGMAGVIAAGDLVSKTPASVRQAPRILNAKERNIGQLIADVEFQGVAGKHHRLSDFANRKGVVIAVTSTSCPLSKKYFPTLVRLARQYSQQGLTFVLVNPMATDKPVAIQHDAKELGQNGLYVHDQQGTLSAALQLTSTTDVLLLDPARTVRYHGAIDDQYGLGYSAAAPRKSYLMSAIDEYLRGQPVQIAATEAPGCLLDNDVQPKLNPDVTYHNRISRLIQMNCGECHRDGGVAPFSLATRADLIDHAKMIETVVTQGTMPPWFASPVEGQKVSPWINDCSLSPSDKTDLLAWLKSDRAEGDVKDASQPVQYASGWTIGMPDLVLKFPEPVHVQESGFMRYQNVVVETGLKEDKWIQGIEIRPGAPEVVHHILVFARPPRGAANQQKNSPQDEINYWAIYVPGNNKQVYPAGFARKLPKGTQIRFQIHYTPNGKATDDVTQIGLMFADKPPENEVKTASLINAWFEIPPGADNHEDSAKFKTSSDVTVLGYLPHMHLRGKACRYEAIMPDGTRETLLDIPRYDFNWQLLYRYAEPRTFTKGTTLKFFASFDNSDKNPANPDPKSTVRWGDQTYDEMLLGYIEYYVPVPKPGESASATETVQFGMIEGREDALFSALDLNDDDKLSREEFLKVSQNPRLKQTNPFMVSAIFVSLDKDHDGELSLEEFRQMRELFRKKKN